jgi:rfaE bifunctional protein nucleotidyltransferase chain/domain
MNAPGGFIIGIMDEPATRIIPRSDLARFRREHRGRCVVFTNGCFDLIHRGHVELLEKARAFGELLVVGINSDSSVSRLKGPARPLMSADDRAFILLQLRSVDYVTIFEEDTPLETIEALRPDVLVKGAEYATSEIAGAEFVSKSGGRVERVEMLESYSTSGLIDKIKKAR